MDYIIFDDNETLDTNMYCCLKDYSSNNFICYTKKNHFLIRNDSSYTFNKFKCIVVQGPNCHDNVSISRNNDDLKKYIVMDVIPYKK